MIVAVIIFAITSVTLNALAGGLSLKLSKGKKAIMETAAFLFALAAAIMFYFFLLSVSSGKYQKGNIVVAVFDISAVFAGQIALGVFIGKAIMKSRLKNVEKASDQPYEFSSYSGEGKCSECGRSLQDAKAWNVPKPVFYASMMNRREEIIDQNGEPLTPDTIAEMASLDNSEVKHICDNCIHLFRKKGES